MVSNVFTGCIVLIVTNLSLLYTAHLIVRKFYRDAPAAPRLVALGVLYYAFIIALFQLLSPFYAITKTWVTILCLLFALITHLRWGALSCIRAEILPMVAWVRDGLKSRWSALMVCCGFVVLLSLSRALLMPPLAWDCLTYHLTFAALWIQKGTLFIFHAPDQIADNAYFPINGDIFASWLLLPFDSDMVVNTMNFPVTLLGSSFTSFNNLGYL